MWVMTRIALTIQERLVPEDRLVWLIMAVITGSRQVIAEQRRVVRLMRSVTGHAIPLLKRLMNKLILLKTILDIRMTAETKSFLILNQKAFIL